MLVFPTLEFRDLDLFHNPPISPTRIAKSLFPVFSRETGNFVESVGLEFPSFHSFSFRHLLSKCPFYRLCNPRAISPGLLAYLAQSISFGKIGNLFRVMEQVYYLELVRIISRTGNCVSRFHV